ncbi:MAG: HD domain-containing protein [Candidatus Coatesbacteria bacterium]
MEARLTAAMRGVFGADTGRIGHALTVWGHARELMAGESVDRDVVTAAAILHDIGIAEAERKHGSADGKWQELEGPPIARRILEADGMDQPRIEHVCRIIANHHSARDIDTPEFRIIWDADWLVNLPDVFPKAESGELARHIGRIFRTPAGAAAARRLFLKED